MRAIHVVRVILFVFPLLVPGSRAQSQTADLHPTMWVTDDLVHTIVRNGNNIYIGGDFNYVGPRIPYGTALDATTGQPNTAFVQPKGIVHAVVPDGSGGWYIGGRFSMVGSEARANVARINADGSLHPWNPGTNSSVLAIAVNGSTVYLGGYFTSAAYQTRHFIAAVDATTGSATSWRPDFNYDENLGVLAIAVSGDKVLVGGQFTKVDGQSRNNIASINADGSLNTWNPSANGDVVAIAVSGSTVYAAGYFTSMAGQSRNHIAAIDATTASATSWNPDADNIVNALCVVGPTVYAGGAFTSIGGQTRNRLAALNASGTGTATSWDPNANGFVKSLAVVGSTVYAGGDFTVVGGETRLRIAAIGATSGTPTSWNPGCNDPVYAVAASGTAVYVGGNYSSIGGLTRKRIAALDATTGMATSWNPDANGSVLSLVVSGGTVYAGGDFTTIGSQSRQRIASLDATTGLAGSWNPSANGTVRALTVSGGTLYAGGNFTSIGGQSRSRIAALDATTGSVNPWSTGADNVVRALAVSGGTLFVGGDFTTIASQSRNYIASLDATNGSAGSWNPSANGVVRTLALSGTSVYAGGDFTTIGTQSRRYIAVLDATSGAATSWDAAITGGGNVMAIALSGGMVYLGGEFMQVGGIYQRWLASVDAATGARSISWSPVFGSVNSVAAVSGMVYVGGGSGSLALDATTYSLIDPFKGFAAFTGIPCSNPTSGGTIAMAQSGSAPFDPSAFTSTAAASGQQGTIQYQWQSSTTSASTGFTDISGATSATYDPGNLSQTTWFKRLARVSCETDWTGAAQSNVLEVTVAMQPNLPIGDSWVTDGTVNAILRHGDIVYLGGFFSHVGPNAPYGTVLDPSTGRPNTAFVKPNGLVRVAVPDGSGGWYIGGDFDRVNGEVRCRLARINSDGSLHAWNPCSSGSVYTMAVGGGVVYVGGAFSSVGGQDRHNLAALDPATGVPTSFDFGTDAFGTVFTMALSGNLLYIGGDFTRVFRNNVSYSNYSRSRIAAINVSTGTVTTWAPGANDRVLSIQVGEGVVYAAGAFTRIGGQDRNRIGAVDANSVPGTANSWNPNANDTVYSIIKSGSTVYAAGAFTSIGGETRNRVASLNESSDLATAWNPNADGTVYALGLSEGTMYLGGAFQYVSGQSRKHIAAVSVSNGSATSWDPLASSPVMTVGAAGGVVYAGGEFITIGAVVRRYIAALDATTGIANSWNPDANALVRAFAMLGGSLHVGGNFTTIGGQPRNRLAALSVADGSANAWNPDLNGNVMALTAAGGLLYVGGSFTGVGSETRNRLAAFDISDGTLHAWDPNASAQVNCLAVREGVVYLGGIFSGANSINGNASRNRLAAVDALTGTANGWAPSANGTVSALATDGAIVYAGGSFGTVGGLSRVYIASINASDGSVTDWNPGVGTYWTGGGVNSIAVSGGVVFVAGQFPNVVGYSSSSEDGPSMATIDAATGTRMSWRPSPRFSVSVVSLYGDKVYIGGSFSSLNYIPRKGFAAFTTPVTGWVGAPGASWSEASNWSPAVQPRDALDITIASGYPLLDADFTVASGRTLKLSGSGSLVVEAGKRLSAQGTVDFGGLPVILKSNASGTASIGRFSTGHGMANGFLGATNVTVERYIPAGRKWRLLTAPLKGSTDNSVFYNWQSNGVPSINAGADVWGVVGTGAAGNGLGTGPGHSMRRYGVSGWENVTDTKNEELFNSTTNNAFALFVTGPYGSGNIASGSAAATLSATGSLITGTHTKTLSTNPTEGQYFLVGNPYASPVDPSLISGDNLGNSFWMWDASAPAGINLGLGTYVSMSRYPVPTYNVPGGTSGFGNEQLTHIQSGQAFFVQADFAGVATSVTFEETDKSSTEGGGMFGSQQTDTEVGTLRVTLQQEAAGGTMGNLDGAVSFFYKGASASVDRMDGEKLMNGTENLLFRRASRSLTFEHRPPLQGRDTLFVRLTNMRQRSYRLSMQAKDLKLERDGELLLVDRFTGESRALKASGEESYDFAVTADTLSTGDRFMVLLSARAAVPGTAQEPSATPVSKMKPYPNPVTKGERVRVDIDPEQAPWRMTLLDAAGREVWSRRKVDGTQGRVEIDMSGMAAGVYRLVMTDAKGRRLVSQVVRQ